MTEVTAKVELKPCPWCGGEAHIDPNSSGLIGEHWPRGACHNCMASGPVANTMNDEAEAAVLWNQRDLRPDDALREAVTTLAGWIEVNSKPQQRSARVDRAMRLARAALNERNPDHDK